MWALCELHVKDLNWPSEFLLLSEHSVSMLLEGYLERFRGVSIMPFL